MSVPAALDSLPGEQLRAKRLTAIRSHRIGSYWGSCLYESGYADSNITALQSEDGIRMLKPRFAPRFKSKYGIRNLPGGVAAITRTCATILV
ncbi:MAG TPA: hypothetical protein VH088_24545 [Terriglobales bacterium]|jgi:hypothetical protein|nr:hypothetical protein [Terriglobales bacterium]